MWWVRGDGGRWRGGAGKGFKNVPKNMVTLDDGTLSIHICESFSSQQERLSERPHRMTSASEVVTVWMVSEVMCDRTAVSGVELTGRTVVH